MLKRLQAQGAIPEEEEAYLHFTLNSFKDLVSKYGAKKVLQEMDEQICYELWRVLLVGRYAD